MWTFGKVLVRMGCKQFDGNSHFKYLNAFYCKVGFFLQLLILSFINGMWPKGSDSTEQSSKKVLIFPPIFVFVLSSCKMKQGCSSGVEIQPLYNLSIFYTILDTVFIEAPSFSNVLGVESILKETPFQICPKGLYRIS